MDSISTIQRFPLYRMLSTIQGAPSTPGMNMSTIRYSPMWTRMTPHEAAALSTVGMISNTDYLSTMNRFIPPIVVEANKGLGNRLKALVSGMCAADEVGKEVRVIWSVRADCGAKFADLFDTVTAPLPVWTHIHNELSVGYTQHACDTQAQWNAVKSTKTVTYLKSGSRFHTTADAKFAYWLKSLKPVAAITTAVATLGDLSATVGVHLRRTDNTVAIQSSPNSAFIATMQARPAGTKFFVASDSAADRAALEAAFPGRIVTVAKNLTRNSKEGLQDALKDFVALSKCSEVLGSKGSSFSEMAALYGGVALTVVTV